LIDNCKGCGEPVCRCPTCRFTVHLAEHDQCGPRPGDIHLCPLCSEYLTVGVIEAAKALGLLKITNEQMERIDPAILEQMSNERIEIIGRWPRPKKPH
jgi:hypothetical protein